MHEMQTTLKQTFSNSVLKTNNFCIAVGYYRKSDLTNKNT